MLEADETAGARGPAATPRGPRRGERLATMIGGSIRRFNYLGLATIVVLIAAWQLAVEAGLTSAQFIVAPSEIVTAAGDLLASGELVANTAHTVAVVLAGWLICLVVGATLGAAVGIWRTPRLLTMGSIDFLRALPPIAFVPVAVLVFGFSATTEIVVIVLGGAWPVLVNTAGGIAQVPRELYDVARTFGLSRVRLVRDVVMPAALPAVIVGARLSMAIALILAVVTEMIGNPAGVGREIILNQQALQPAQMYVYIVTIGFVGLALNGALELGSRLTPWSTEGRDR